MIAKLRLGHVEVGIQVAPVPGSNLPWCHFLSDRGLRAVVEDWRGRV
jgi:hypothetical protein